MTKDLIYFSDHFAKIKSKIGLAVCLLLIFASGFTNSSLAQQTDIHVHDPVMIKDHSTYYVFSTGKGVTVWSSPDMEHWTRQKPVFDSAPEWAFDLVPNYDNVEWAPDISYHDGKYYLYYSVSQFGRNHSAIGVATNKTLHQDAPNYKWVDHGPVVQSVPGRDMWNAIDPNLAYDDNGTPWLTFGSFWKGIKIVKMQDDLLDIARSPQTWHSTAARHRYWKLDERDAGDAANPELDYSGYSKEVLKAEHNMQNGAIEAPFIFKKGDFYYLFVSWGRCCRGKKSTYKIMVGRSKKITGPYLDKANEDMLYGGGSLVAKGNDRWAAVGHEAAYTFNGQDYLVFHGYDNDDKGISKLIIKKIHWKDGWPEISL